MRRRKSVPETVERRSPVIISASYRTDIPAFYPAWFRARLDAGWCDVLNPYGGLPVRVDLTQSDGFVFWTRNAEPFLDVLHALRPRWPFVVHYTVTGYPRPLETSVMPVDRSLAMVRTLTRAFGRRAVVWRYDPIMFTSLIPPEWHLRTFDQLCHALRDEVDEVVVSMAHIYRKTARHLAAAGKRYDFTWEDPDAAVKRELLGRMAACASDHGLRLSLCGKTVFQEPGQDFGQDFGVMEARCIDAGRLADVAGRPLTAKAKPHRACGCHQSRDIGAYDTCVHGCTYCYAVDSRARAKAYLANHTPTLPFLGGSHD